MRIAPVFWLALGLTTLACTQRPRPSGSGPVDRPATAPIPKSGNRDAARERVARASTLTAEAVASDAATAVGLSDQSISLGGIEDPATMIIRTGTASIRIDSLEPALAAVRALAARIGGYVANTQLQAGNAQYRQATLEVKAPAGRFDDLVAGLELLGKVEAVNVTAEDVGEEFVDVSARVANSRRLESRLIDLLATRTGRLQDVLSVERELARVREEIERYEGRLRYLRSRTAMSTLSITIHEPLPVVGDPGSNILARALERAWRNFMELLAGFIASLGLLVPVILAGGAAGWGFRRFRRPAPAG